MKKLSDLFDVKVGLPASKFVVHKEREKGYIPFLRPASTQARTISGWVDPTKVKEKYIHEAQSLFVSTNGEGSHSFSYVCPLSFVCNNDVHVLIPKISMDLHHKIFYARCITMNRFRFTYGRKPKGDRLKNLELPTFPESWHIQTPKLEWTNNPL